MSTAADSSIEQQQVTVETKFGRTRLAIQIGILTLVSAMALYITLLSDRHNDGRYVTKESFEQEQRNEEKVRELVDGEARRRIDAQDRKLDEISADVKALLRESRRNP